jgi:hypothetical protein
MRYIKTYESFYSKDNMARDIAMILDPAIVEIAEFDELHYKDTSMFRVYVTEDDLDDLDSGSLEKLRNYMIEEHGLHLTTNTFTEGGMIILTEKPIEDTCIDWLNVNYSKLEAVESKNYKGNVIYRYKPKYNILFHDMTNEKVYINSNIWCFFEYYFGMEDNEIQKLTEKWLSEAYNLNLTTTRFGFYHGRFEKCE